MWFHSLKVAQLLRSAACLHTNQYRSYLNHLVFQKSVGLRVYIVSGRNLDVTNPLQLYRVVTITFRAMQLLDFVHRPLFQKYYRVQKVCFRKVDVCLYADERVGRYSFWSVRLADKPIE